MVIDTIDIEGMADLPAFHMASLERTMHFQGPTPQTVALGDAIELFFAALNPMHLQNLLHRWGLISATETPEILTDPFPAQAQWSAPTVGADLVADPGQRAITVTVGLHLDPILFRQLRTEAARQPRLVTALAGGPKMTVSIGALFNRRFDALALSINHVRIGEESFPTLSSERPRWLTQLLTAIGERFHRPDLRSHDTATIALNAATSRPHFHRYTAWQHALTDRLGAVRVVQSTAGTPMLLVDDRPIRRWGARGAHLAALAAAIHLSDADIVWIESGDDMLLESVNAGALEQVLLTSGSGDVSVLAAPVRNVATQFRPRERS